MTPCATPLSFETLCDYLARDDGAEAAGAAVEEHLFGCATCTDLAADVEALTSAIRQMLPPVIDAARLARLRGAGARILETHVAAGQSADATFAHDLDVLLHILEADLRGVSRVDVELTAEPHGVMATLESVPFDPGAGAVLIACQRHFRDLRYPEDLGFRVVSVEAGARRVLGEYLIRHHWPAPV